MRIGINGRFLIAKQTGVQRAAYNLIVSIVKADRQNEYFIFTSQQEKGHPTWNYKNVTVVGSKLESGSVFKNLFWEQINMDGIF